MAGGFSDNFYETLFSIIDNRNEYEVPEQHGYGLMENMQNDEEVVSSDEYDSLLRELEVLKQMQSQEQQNDVEDFAPETDEYESDLSFLLQDIGSYEGNTGVVNMVASTLKTKDSSVNISKTDNRLLKYLNSLPENIKSSLLITSGNDYDGHENNSKHYSNKALDLRYVPQLHDYIKNDPTAKALGINVLNPNHGTAPHTHIQIRQNGGLQTGSKSTSQLPNVKVVTKKPLVVTNPNDPRLKAYQDSMNIYNLQKLGIAEWEYSKYLTPKQRTDYWNNRSRYNANNPLWRSKYNLDYQDSGDDNNVLYGDGETFAGLYFAKPKPFPFPKRAVKYVPTKNNSTDREKIDETLISNESRKRLPNLEIVPTETPFSNQFNTLPIPNGSPLNLNPIYDGNWSVTQGRGNNTQNTRKFNNKAEFDAFLEAQRSVGNIPTTTTYEGPKSGSAIFSRFQTGGNVGDKPTMQDSLALYNNAKKVLNYYKNNNYKNKGVRYEDNLDISYFDNMFNKFKNIPDNFKIKTDKGEITSKNIPYRVNIDKNKFAQKEDAFNILDLRSPYQLYDRRINPTLTASYSNKKSNDPLNGDLVNISMYDPILIKPVSMLTPEERALRIQRYGRASGLNINEVIKQSVPNSVRKTKPIKNTSDIVDNRIQFEKGTTIPTPSAPITSQIPTSVANIMPLNLPFIGDWSATQGRGKGSQETRTFSNKFDFDTFVQLQKQMGNIPLNTEYKGNNYGSALFNRFKTGGKYKV